MSSAVMYSTYERAPKGELKNIDKCGTSKRQITRDGDIIYIRFKVLCPVSEQFLSLFMVTLCRQEVRKVSYLLCGMD